MNLIRLCLLVFLGALLGGCASSSQGWVNSPLKDTKWQLLTIEAPRGDKGREFVGNTVDITMELQASGSAVFKLGCEKGQGSWDASSSMINTKGEFFFRNMELAASSCPPDLLVQRFLGDFDFFSGYVLIQNHLYLNTQSNEAIYGWRKITP
jgi:hypothetical protein